MTRGSAHLNVVKQGEYKILRSLYATSVDAVEDS
jgi:hypothetical protein